MEFMKLKKQQLLTLKAKIKGLADGGARCRKFIGATSHKARDRHWNEKRSIGKEARYHLIAYGLLRGLEYDIIEPNSNKDHLKSLWVFDFNYLAQIIQHHCPYRDKIKWSPANLQRLMMTGTMSVPVIPFARVFRPHHDCREVCHDVD